MREVPCGECGEPVGVAEPLCEDCVPSAPIPSELESVNVVEVPELAELIEHWKEEQEKYPDTEKGEAAAAAVRVCATELEELLGES